jgi:DNA-binding MarR family transcriptional regulator
MASRSARGAARGAREEEAFVSLLRATDRLQRRIVELFKREDLSLTQYNVLRILRGAGPGGLSCGEVAGRMITRDPDVTRLLDRLEHRGLVVRTREARDRRVVRTRITNAGLELLTRLDEPVRGLHLEQLGHLGARRLAELVALLERATVRAD